jgi:integrase
LQYDRDSGSEDEERQIASHSLSEPARAILRKRQHNGRDHVFGRGASGFQDWSRSRAALDDRIAGPRPGWVLHDLRRLASSRMHEQLAVAPHVVERVLAHVGHQSAVARIYDRSEYYFDKKRALEKWAAYVDEIVTGEPLRAKVVRLQGRGCPGRC